ncbi:hypothetical protein CEXT_296771 [Caerostris extrusa]|uniref:Uncharacterized protein n=1 Tax=Caerostris extrusa TaxID=172846 RepID=A0AAV4PS73_CAEEX|nr:hypothetical protein CEXT_296771 [Caerostris extrusa]
MSPLRGTVICDCPGNDAKRMIQPPFQFVSPLSLSSGRVDRNINEAGLQQVNCHREKCQSSSPTLRMTFSEKDFSSPEDFD